MEIENSIKLFESKKVRTHWVALEEQWYFSVIDVIEILSQSPRPRKYWNALKTKLQSEGSELSHKLGQLKMQAGMKGGKIAKDARLAHELKTGKKVITGDNFLPPSKQNKKFR